MTKVKAVLVISIPRAWKIIKNPPHSSNSSSTTKSLQKTKEESNGRSNESPKLSIRILTHNIRYATTSPFPGEEPWAARAPHLITELRFHTQHNSAAFICLQEALLSQVADILGGLNAQRGPSSAAEWSYIGVGRDDGAAQGEFAPILFRPRAWALRRWHTRWLSPTPERPSRGWDAASTRIVTVGEFERVGGGGAGQRVLALNTHMDDQGVVARREGARLIRDLVRDYLKDDAAGGNGPIDVFLAGDFNSQPNEEAYQILNAVDSPVRDVREYLLEDEWYGHWDTFTGFDDGAEEPKKRIDFIFLGREGRLMPVTYGVLGNRFRGIYNSDHRAVVADVKLGGLQDGS